VIAPSLVAESIESLPTLPLAVAELSRLLATGEASAAELERVVRPDPALTANLLRVANSAMFRGVRPIGTVREAVARMGTRNVFAVAAGAAFRRVIPARIPGFELDATAFWRHAVATATIAARLDRKHHGPGSELVFTAGLLHDVGKLVLGVFLERYAADLATRLAGEDLSFVAAERELLGTAHPEVGEAIARRWGLPAPIGLAARYHHQPTAAPRGAGRHIAGLVHIGSALAHLLGFGADVGELHRQVDPEVAAALGLDAAALERLACDCLDEIVELAAAIRPDAGDGA
jgi:putative nucleotidyltransferase with HDIG domain